MLLDKNGASLALVVALNVAPEYRERIALDITRALSAAGNPAKLRRFMNAARHGEEEAYAELAAANEIIAEARKFYLWVSETISKCAYNAEELEQGVKGWEPLADSIYNGTMASWRDTLGVEE